MACRLIGAKPLPEQMLTFCQLGGTNLSEIWTKNTFIHENAFESVVCGMAAILSGVWVIYVHGSRFAMFCCALVLVFPTHILQGY